jgi:Co/Zn/Cd efflux system component
LSLGALAIGGAWISRVALLKGAAMAMYGIGILCYAGWRAWLGIPPEAITRGVVGLLALCVREGDANMRSVWLCTRNDVIGNLAVLIAAAGVFGSGTRPVFGADRHRAGARRVASLALVQAALAFYRLD